jgi:hypothetical protein
LRSVDELDLGSFLDHFPQHLSVPIGEADAAVRFGLADDLAGRCAKCNDGLIYDLKFDAEFRLIKMELKD